MITTKVGFITYGVHKDGLKDPLGAPFIDGQIVAQAKDALRGAGLKLELVEAQAPVAAGDRPRSRWIMGMAYESAARSM